MKIPVRIVDHEGPDPRAEAIALAIMEEAFDTYYGERWTARQLSSFTPLNGVHLAIARLDGANLGFALRRHVYDEAELLLLAVAKRWQGKGIGRQLVNHCVDSARRAKMKTLHLEVRANNPAIEFYHAMGFESIHRRPGYYRAADGATFDALSLQLAIN